MPDEPKTHHVCGPPGCGKSTYIKHQIERAAEIYDPSFIMACSFARSSVSELVRKEIPIPEENIGTLHAFSYRALGHPEICETSKHLKEFSAQHPRYAMSGGTREDVDDGFVNGGDSDGDNLLMEYSRLRALMRPRELWSGTVLNFAHEWEGYKKETGSMDFTDLIEIAWQEVERPKCYPMIGFMDEAQDLTPLELALWRKWSKTMEQSVLVYDIDQSIYGFKGADPAALYDPNITPIVLKQSYRVPRSVQQASENLISQIKDRYQREYLPRDDDGEVVHVNYTFKDTEIILELAHKYTDQYKSVLLLTTCSYMLAPLITTMREQGIPFSNPYRRRRRDWNPLHKVKKQQGAATRVAAFCSAFLREQKTWTLPEIELWMELTKRVGKRKWKEYAAALPKDKLLPPVDLLGIMEVEDISAAQRDGPRWLMEKLNAAWRGTAGYALKVAERDTLGLEEEPLLKVGTIHCSPPGEPILTTDGWVFIEELVENKHRLASYNRKGNYLKWGWKQDRSLGYSFKKSQRWYSGPLVKIKTKWSTSRVTPDHRIPVKFNDDFFDKWAVYLMKRGDWWRIGRTSTGHRPYKSGSLTGRLAHEKGDALWILGIYETKKEAIWRELYFQALAGLPGSIFDEGNGGMWSNDDLANLHDSLVEIMNDRVEEFLKQQGLDKRCPLWTRTLIKSKEPKRNMREIFVTEAANLISLSGYIETLINPAGFKEVGIKKQWGKKGNRKDGRWSPDLEVATIERDYHVGLIYGLDVPPEHYYISGGNVVHNSYKGGEEDVVILCPDLSPSSFYQLHGSTEGRDAIIRQMFVGCTRSRESLILAAPSGRLHFPWWA